MNISKTKVVIFSKGKVKRFPRFYLGEEEVDVAYDYVYLGVTFNYKGTFTKAMEKQINQARKAMFIVLEKARILNLPFDVICELYEKCVIPVLLYGSEVWGFSNLRDVEIFPIVASWDWSQKHLNLLQIVCCMVSLAWQIWIQR